MYTILYYSPTGNTKYLADRVAQQLLIDSSYVQALDKTPVDGLKANKHLILLFPIHGFNPPRTVKRFTKNGVFEGFEKVSLIAVGCNEMWVNSGVSLGLRKQFKKHNIEIVVDEIMAMPLTIVMNLKEDVKNKQIDEAIRKIDEICTRIQEHQVRDRAVPFSSKLMNLIGKVESPAARLFGLELHAKKSCTSCGICWNNCPENNIKQGKTDKPKFGFSCSMCMRCIYQCPVQAITPYVSKFIPIKNGYQIKR